MEPFSLYLQVALYAAVALSVPFLLLQVWGFVAPGLYPHERGYAIPFVLLSTVSFVLGAAFAYYVLFPPAARYLLGLGQDFRLLLKATDYFDFIVLIMLAMGVVFQMPAVTYVLARIGLVTAGLLVRSWRISTVIILVAAAVLSPTSDVLNMMLFAAPMAVLYLVSILIAWCSTTSTSNKASVSSRACAERARGDGNTSFEVFVKGVLGKCRKGCRQIKKLAHQKSRHS